MATAKSDRSVCDDNDNTIIRGTDLTRRFPPACENLVAYATSQPSLFKRHQLLPVRDLKLLARDYTVRARDPRDSRMQTDVPRFKPLAHRQKCAKYSH